MKRIKINGQNEVRAHDYCRGNQMFLEIVNLQTGSITIKASISGKEEQFETMKFIDDDSDMVFTPSSPQKQATLPKGMYTVIAEGSDDVNDDAEIVLL